MLRVELLLPLLLALFLGGAIAATSSDRGSIMDPDGQPTVNNTSDLGSGMDPDG